MKIINHGKILEKPAESLKETQHSVAYELGRFFQLDDENCLFVASLDEQGGGDKCVGNDGFIIKTLDDIKPENAFPINRPETEYKLKSGGTAFLAKFPCNGAFAPLGATLSNGQPHPAAGTGFLISGCISFKVSESMDENSEILFETLQLKWDGKSLEITGREYVDELLGHKSPMMGISNYCPKEQGFLVPFSTAEGTVIFDFQYDGTAWKAAGKGEPFMVSNTPGFMVLPETEPSILQKDDDFICYTRGSDKRGRMYISKDGFNFKFLTDRKNTDLPQVLNQNTDGSLYLVTNSNLDMLRNPLIAYPVSDDYSFEPPLTVHDQDGVRDDSGESVPFVDHGLGANVLLQGQRRHFLTYRVCDLCERTFHKGMEEIAERIHKGKAPTKRASFGGLYLAEIVVE